MIRLEDVNETNWRYSLHVSEVQKETMPQRAYMRSWALWRQATVFESGRTYENNHENRVSESDPCLKSNAGY